MNLNSLKMFKEFVYADLFRHTGSTGLKIFLKSYFKIPGFRYMFWFRAVNYCVNINAVLALIARARLRHYTFKYGIMIPYTTQIDKGFYIGHFSCIVISSEVVIGKNVNVSQGVTIGKSFRGERQGAAVIGDEVYIAPGAKIVGKIIIGRNVAIGANAVVIKDVPENSAAGGIPAKIISMNGAEGYINNKV